MAVSKIVKSVIGRALTSSTHGVIKIPFIKKQIVWGSFHASGMAYEQGSGSYAASISLTEYGFTGAVWANVSPAYPGGLPFVGVSTITTSTIKILCNVNNAGCYLHWIVIGDYS